VRGPRPAARFLIRLGALVAIGAALFIFNGIKFYLTPWSQTTINSVVKFLYGDTGQKETTVVLFREENLRTLKESYPVSYERHAEVLEAMSFHRPRALFMDFVFLDKRTKKDTEALRDAICNLVATAKTKVYLAVLEPIRAPADPNEPWVFQCATQVSAQMDQIQGASGVLTYAHGVAKGTAFLPTPAFAMAGLKLDPDDAQRMEIIWGNGVAPLNQKWMKGCERSGHWFWNLVSVFTENPLKSVKLQCPYTRTISVGHLLGSTNDTDVVKALEDKVVFYGAAFHLTGDRVASPVFEELPGVYLHAMAYDNLRTLGPDYKRADRQLLIPSLVGRYMRVPLTGVVDVLLLLVTVGILLLVEEPPGPLQKLRERSAHMRTSLKLLAVAVPALFMGAILKLGGGIWLALLDLLILMAIIAFVDLAPPAKQPPSSLQGYVLRGLLMLVVPLLAVGAFVAVDRLVSLEAALLLVAVPAYFLYKVVVGRDTLFAATAVLLVLAALVIVSPPVNLGPRNVIAYVMFFEVARRLLRYADDAAVKYREQRDKHPNDDSWGRAKEFMPALDWLFSVLRRRDITANTPLEIKEDTHARPAGAPA
jgi:hypothetical protein